MKIFTLCVLLFLISKYNFSQNTSLTNSEPKTYGHPVLSFNYSLNNPTANWSTRFGMFNTIGGEIGYKNKNNWMFLTDGHFIFGNQFKEPNLLDNLKDSYGNITDDQGNIATVPIFTRGFTFSYLTGKLISFKSANNGLLIKGGIGFLSYKYRIETNSINVPQIEGDYRMGYDRLTQGILLSEFIGYQYVSEKNLYNFYIGLFLQQGFTRNMRTIFYDQPNTSISTKLRNDNSYGIKIGWNIPFFNDKPKEYYYY
jgi:hypothetical protein